MIVNSARTALYQTESDDNREIDGEFLMQLEHQKSVIFESVNFSCMLHSQGNLMCSL